MKSRIAPLVLLACMTLGPTILNTPSSLAQTITGTVRGHVTDPSGAAVPGATIQATNIDTGVVTNGVTDASGVYNIQFLPIGTYQLSASAKNFSTTSIGPFSLQIDQTLNYNIALKVGKASTTVKVSGSSSPLLNTENATLGTTLTSNTLSTMPLNGRNFSSATLFLPGAVSTTPTGFIGSNGGSGTSNGTERDTNASGVPSFNGNRQQTNNYILDGVEINETVNNTIGYNPAPDSLQQMRVITGNADAEYGNVNGGEIIAITKGGTNHFHGSAYEYLESEVLDANTWANNFAGAQKNSYTQNMYGATIGGPIKHNKMFFFGDYEGLQYHTGGQGTASVATNRMRQGDFSQVLAVKGVQLYNTQNGFQPYANNQIPIDSPVAKFLFAHPEVYPAPNKTPTDGLAQNNYLGYTKAFQKNNQGDVRIDYRVSPSDSLMGRYSIGDAYDDLSHAVLPIFFPTGNDYPFQSFVINEVHTFSPALVNEFRAGFSRVRWIQGEPTDPSGVFGLNGNNLVGIPFKNQPYPGFSSMTFGNGVQVSDFGTTAGGTALTDNSFVYGDDLTWEHGTHVTKFGVQFVRYQQNNFYPGNEGVLGQFRYSGQFTSNPLIGGDSGKGFPFADFVLDQGDFAGVGALTGPWGQRQWRDAVYAQDDWKLRSNLTLNLGLRYAYDQPIYEVNNKQLNVNLSDPSSCTGANSPSNPCLEFAGQNGNSRALYNPVYTEFMPRFGFAWSVNPRTVVRGGYGITDDLEGTGANLRLTQNPPFFHSFLETASAPTATSPGSPIAVQNGFSTGASNVSVDSTQYFAWTKNLHPSVIQEFNLTTQFQLSNNTSAQLGYVGQLGQHLIVAQNGNQWPAPCTASCTNAPFYNLVGQTGAVKITQSEGISNYNALQATLQHQQSNGLEYTINYTWSRAMTDNPGFFGTPGINGASAYWQNAYDPLGDYGPAGYDTRNNLNANAVWQLPFGHGRHFGGDWGRWKDEAFGGWQVSGTAILYSGFPVTIGGPNNANVNSYASRANQYLPLKIVHRSVQNWFGTDPSAKPCAGAFNGTCAYGPELPGQFGTARVGSERAPGYRQIDLSFFKTFPIAKSQNVQFRADMFNAFNLASYNNPDSYIGDTTFGQITSTRSPQRQTQFSVDYQF